MTRGNKNYVNGVFSLLSLSHSLSLKLQACVIAVFRSPTHAPQLMHCDGAWREKKNIIIVFIYMTVLYYYMTRIPYEMENTGINFFPLSLSHPIPSRK